jgi:hypothetical protein
MSDPEFGGEDTRREPTSPNDVGEHSTEVAGGPVSSFELLRRVIVGVIRSVSDGAELISTSVSEEFVQFRVDVEHRVIIILLFIAGILAVGVGLMLFLRQLIGSWPPTLLLMGGCFLGVGIFLTYRWRPEGD